MKNLKFKKMKKVITSIALGLVIFAGGTSYAAGNNSVSTTIRTPNEKALKDFNKQFKNSVTPDITLSKGGLILQAQVDGHKVTSAYNKKGNWVYTVKLYPTESLAKNIMSIVKRNYDDYYISSMEKIDQPGDAPVFIVYMRNQDSFKTVRVVGNDVELVQDFKKG
jgi:hypothetical protein